MGFNLTSKTNTKHKDSQQRVLIRKLRVKADIKGGWGCLFYSFSSGFISYITFAVKACFALSL